MMSMRAIELAHLLVLSADVVQTQTAEHFLLHCAKYQDIRKNTVEVAFDMPTFSRKTSFCHNFEFLLF